VTRATAKQVLAVANVCVVDTRVRASGSPTSECRRGGAVAYPGVQVQQHLLLLGQVAHDVGAGDPVARRDVVGVRQSRSAASADKVVRRHFENTRELDPQPIH